MATASVSEAQIEANQGYSIWKVILAASSGTVIEWYDFYIFGTLATTLAPRFYPASAGETISLLLYLATFAVGFVVRPFGAIFFGRIGDLVGRKYAFLVTLLIMGSCTAAIGLLPSYDVIKMGAPIALLLLRILQTLKDTGKTSKTPLGDALKGWENWKRILTTLFGATAGQGVVWYTGQFYALYYITTVLKLDTEAARGVIAVGILLGMPLFTFFGALSDKIGRKKIMMAGMLCGALFYVPIYHGMVSAARTDVVKLKKVIVKGEHEPKLASLNSAGKTIIAREKASLPASQKAIKAGTSVVPPRPPNFPLLVFYIFLQMVFVCMVYGPMAAYLVEAFPAKVRYTSLSLPYHMGNGIFGGLLPLIGLYVNSATKNIYAGLYYPMIVAGVCFIVGSLTLKETRDVRIWDE